MMRTLLVPYYCSLRHRLTTRVHWRSHATRDVILAAFAVCIMIAIYSGSIWVLDKISEFSALGYLPASHILSLILMTLFFMLLASCVAISFGTLFLGQDLDLVLASPLGPEDFFFGKYCSVLIGASWMPIVFISPLILAFGQFYSVPPCFYLLSAMAILPYFLIPTAIAMPLATAFVLIIPSNRNKEALFLILGAFLYGIYALVDFIGKVEGPGGGASEIFRIITILSAHSISWLPSNWVSIFLGAWLDTDPQKPQWLYLWLLFSCAVTLAAFAYLALRFLHFSAYTKSQNTRLRTRVTSQCIRFFLRTLLPFLPQHISAMIEKEIKTVVRDISQVVQILMLVSICVVYLYNLKIFAAFESVPVGDKIWWQNFLYVSNIMIGAFITTAISTRFIFPSISLEGRSLWILQNAPVDVRELLHARLLCWLPPVSIVSCVLFGAGAFAIKASVVALILNVIAALSISLGIVGLALGMGALFANFGWEHASQLSAGLGNFLFMLASTALISVNSALVALALIHWQRAFVLLDSGSILVVLISLMTMALIDAYTARWALDVGANSLERMMD